MCGVCGYFDISKQRKAEKNILEKMANTLIYRGPDSSGYLIKDNLGLGFRRLSLIDLEGGNQPLYNEDKTIFLVCNGEIYNYRELKKQLIQQGHKFRTNTDVEVLIHLYEEYGLDFLNKLNGQFAFVLYDSHKQQLFLARDQMGICPLFYTIVDKFLIFASEIKAILAHPLVKREVDLVGLDQILTFPGLVSPRTMFKNINSLKSGHYINIKDSQVKITEYWDLDYPKIDETKDSQPESYYIEKLQELIIQSVKYRLNADVPVGVYVSGGLDSSLIAAIVNKIHLESDIHSFSIGFTDKDICESKYREILLKKLNFIHHEICFDSHQISAGLMKAIYHSECPVKETYNTASLALSNCANSQNIKAVLTGEGADELFAGYVGYRFEELRNSNLGQNQNDYSLETILEDELRLKVWGDKNIFYEKDLYAYRETKLALYSLELNERFSEFDCLNFELINQEKLQNRHSIHQRSYLDFKLRLSDHLLADHGDRMALANSVEARYPFLDINLVEFTKEIPPFLKLNKFQEKYILKQTARDFLPTQIIDREKFAFHAPGSPYLLKQNIEYINDILSSDLLKKQGYFNPNTIENIKQQYLQDGFRLNLPFDIDLLIIPLTFGIFLQEFQMPELN
ncbi:asparagine synthase (glutamine-hydrolyzing) [Rivularia sp. UHCC 0363]|uniref:asparagine synthase (glutamine-hydrolyzing) n=1 Tax=Rivularia sp. UHCC 0363 TaxID=3110244 RepID=UPI002B1F1844|nr:asparagine synthase (glutamine-hydrolyzing) [Rivularia sp. UHCC 0363]MEA5595926.1 asparagine synthase (glutamine-hydrolyzing) [Rivularia sp. UHCC 0363]